MEGAGGDFSPLKDSGWSVPAEAAKSERGSGPSLSAGLRAGVPGSD